ncbi:MAG: hypothetical protein M3077_05995 [Candidatus Dormibacteraeota bacterium]|nr:hypothetical protein [Candidatus Dormibacteraeota bacterium]
MKHTRLRSQHSTGVLQRLRGKSGQAIVLLALTGSLLIGGVGLAVDLALGYMYSIAAERAAAAAALSGVEFMPDQFSAGQATPVGSRNDATDRALDEAKRNGFDTNDLANGVSVTAAAVPGHANQLKVTVARNSPVFFMQLFGFSAYRVARTAVAAYLPPISLGQPGSQLGASVSSLGGSSQFFMRTEGWATDRQQGDAYTPNPNGGALGASNDVHQISYVNGSEARDATISDRGGYNFRLVVPAGGSGGVVQVYNAAFSPDGSNYCDNDNSVAANRTCNAIRGNYHMHEDDGGPFNFGTTANYAAMRYTLYLVKNNFIRSTDVVCSQVTVLPIDARNYAAANNQYKNVNTGATITQLYTGTAPSNMLIYHNWIDVANYNGGQDGGLVRLTQQNLSGACGAIGGVLQAGTYRLRVDTLNADGTVSTNGSNAGAHKGYAVRVVNGDAGRTACGTCALAGWDDMAIYTPIDIGAGGNFAIKLFQLRPEYAGLTVNIDIYDPGDIASSNGTVILNILDPSGAIANSPQGINIYDLGVQRSNLASGNYAVIASAQNGNTQASFTATGNGVSRNGHWVHVELPVPSNYNPTPGADWWSLQYVTGPNTTATDTVTVAVGLKGGPVHLVP